MGRPRLEPQTWIVDEGLAYAFVAGRRFLIDASDVPLVAGRRWSAVGKGYAATGDGSSTILLHRLLLGLSKGDGLEGDHRSRDTLDNRRENLRITTRGGNTRNAAKKVTASLQFKGCRRRGNRFYAYIRDGKRQQYLGAFGSEREAAIAYDAAARARFGEFAGLNFQQ